MLRDVFLEFGFIEEIRIQKDKGYAFVRFQTHESAGKAICSVHGRNIGYRAVKVDYCINEKIKINNEVIFQCSWGKERAASTATKTTPAYPYNPYGYTYFPQQQQYPPYYTYSGYGNYGGYGGSFYPPGNDSSTH
eukprot:TRINITY_DN675_c0_g1_i1.p1 TRINITY_DN675_c0_g1~~TRINITY_DN675_c0_g1_i1.p1  ORF type:complete len:135 (+),score=25.04 TRINITY_DN675_c0_g1_i1:382-786(+)